MRDTFEAEDAALIMKLPVHTQWDDSPAWHFGSKGIFSVRSAYKVTVEKVRRERTSQLQVGCMLMVLTDQGFWKKIWGLSVPNKVKHFVWRLAHDSLAL